MKLIRLTSEPVLKPKPANQWEAAAVFNAAGVCENGLVHMIYRATNIGCHARFGKYINSLGYAVSNDLINWNRLNRPILTNNVPQEWRGPEDPRIVKIGDTFYMTYTGFGGRFADDYRICLATSKNLINWKRQDVLLDEPNKNASLFPQKINNEFLLLHRRHPDIWISASRDLKNFHQHGKIMSPIPHTWQSARIGIAGPPVRHRDGWLLFYHGVDKNNHYRLGAALLDYRNPRKVLARQKEPVIEPELEWEKKGFVPNVIFSCATIEMQNKYIVIYGGADTVIGVASIAKKDVKF